MATVGESFSLWRKRAVLEEARLHVARDLALNERGLRDFLDADAAISAGDAEAAFRKGVVAFTRLEQMRCNLLSLGDDLVGRHRQGAAADRGRAAPEGARAEGDFIG